MGRVAEEQLKIKNEKLRIGLLEIFIRNPTVVDRLNNNGIDTVANLFCLSCFVSLKKKKIKQKSEKELRELDVKASLAKDMILLFLSSFEKNKREGKEQYSKWVFISLVSGIAEDMSPNADENVLLEMIYIDGYMTSPFEKDILPEITKEGTKFILSGGYHKKTEKEFLETDVLKLTLNSLRWWRFWIPIIVSILAILIAVAALYEQKIEHTTQTILQSTK